MLRKMPTESRVAVWFRGVDDEAKNVGNAGRLSLFCDSILQRILEGKSMPDFDEADDFETWRVKAEALFPWPDYHDVFAAIQGCGTDRAEERVRLIKRLLDAHYEASASGVFNDE